MSSFDKEKFNSLIREARACLGNNPKLTAILDRCAAEINDFDKLPEKDIQIKKRINRILSNIKGQSGKRPRQYSSLTDAFKEPRDVLLSINKIYYGLPSVEDYTIFKQRFESEMKGYDTYPINVYLIIPDDVEHSIRVKYKSSDEKELDLVVSRLAEYMKIDKSLISVSSYGNESDIITPNVGTLKMHERSIAEMTAAVAYKFEDEKLSHGILSENNRSYILHQIGSSLVNEGKLKDGDILFLNIHNLNINNIGSITTSDQSNVHIGDNIQRKRFRINADEEDDEIQRKLAASDIDTKQESNIEKEGDEDDEDDKDKDQTIIRARKWIKKNPPEELSRGVHHEKYVDAMKYIKSKYLTLKQFRKVMIKMGYKDGSGGKHRVWVKEDMEDEVT
jgi:hypothetical protein